MITFSVAAFLLATILLGTLAQLVLKAAVVSRTVSRRKTYLLYGCAICMFGINSLVYVAALRHISLSVAMPFLATIYALVPCGGILFFGERVKPSFWFGVILICCGIVFATVK